MIWRTSRYGWLKTTSFAIGIVIAIVASAVIYVYVFADSNSKQDYLTNGPVLPKRNDQHFLKPVTGTATDNQPPASSFGILVSRSSQDIISDRGVVVEFHVGEQSLSKTGNMEITPVSGVYLAVTDTQQKHRTSMVTDKDGVASVYLQPDSYVLEVEGAPWSEYEPSGFSNPVSLDISSADRKIIVNVNVRAKAGLTVFGKVLAKESGKPIGPGILDIRDHQTNSTWTIRGQVNDEGIFNIKLPGRSTGEYFMILSNFTDREIRGGYIQVDKNPYPITFTLAGLCEISGKVVFDGDILPGDAPKFNFGIYGEQGSFGTSLKNDMTFSIKNVPAGIYQITADIPKGFVITKPSFLYNPGRFQWLSSDKFNIDSNNVATQVTIHIKKEE